MNQKDNRPLCGVGFTGLLALTFITLKLCGEISWPWIWVLSPMWLPAAIFGLALAVVILRSKRRRKMDLTLLTEERNKTHE